MNLKPFCSFENEYLDARGDLVSRLSNGLYGASYGLLCGLIGDTKWTY